MSDSTESALWSASGRVIAFLALAYVGSFGLILVDEFFGPKFIYHGIKAACPESHDRMFRALRALYRPLLTVSGY